MVKLLSVMVRSICSCPSYLPYHLPFCQSVVVVGGFGNTFKYAQEEGRLDFDLYVSDDVYVEHVHVCHITQSDAYPHLFPLPLTPF